jgi:hypothetical protein
MGSPIWKKINKTWSLLSKCIQSQTPHKYVTIKQSSIEQYEWLDGDYLEQHAENMGTHQGGIWWFEEGKGHGTC